MTSLEIDQTLQENIHGFFMSSFSDFFLIVKASPILNMVNFCNMTPLREEYLFFYTQMGTVVWE